MEYYITQKDLENVQPDETINLYTKDSKGWHWTENTLKLSD